jgi:excisionase family DNA binding protein
MIMKKQDFEGKYGITIAEAVVAIGVCERKVRGLIAEGKIPHYRIGRSVRIPWPELKEWLRNGGTEGEAVRIDDILKPMIANIEAKHIQRNNGGKI